MMHLRSRRAMIAVAASASMILTVTAVPESPLSPSAAQAATASKTQDTNLDFRCNVYAAGGKGNVNYDISTGMHVTMPESVALGEEFDVSIKIDPVSIVNEQAGLVPGQPSFEEGNTKANRIRFALSADAELVESNLPGTTLKGRLLEVYGMMQPSKSGSKVTISYQELKLKLKAKSSGTLAVQTPKKYPKLDNLGRVSASNMVWGQGIAGKLFFKTPGLKVTCMTDQFKPLGSTQVGKFAEVNEPKYADIEVKQQDTATSTDTSAAPAGTAYAKGADAPAWAKVAADGTVTVNPGLDVEPGDYTVPIVVTYPDTSADNTVVKVKVTVKPKSELNDPKYTGTTKVEQEGSVTVAAPEGAGEVKQYAAGAGAPAWATVNSDGTITVKPDLKVTPGDYQIPVVATYTDGSTDNLTAKVTVTKKPDNQIHDPKYTDVTVKQGDEQTAANPEDVAEGAKFAAGEGAPAWATVNKDGTVTVKPGLEIKPGDYTVPVVVKYPDQSSDKTELKVTVTKKPDNEIHDPQYADVTVKQQDTETVEAPKDVAEGAKFAAGAGAPEWAKVAADGTVTVNPGLDIAPGKYTVPVKVTYPDKSGDDTTVNVTVTVKPKNEIHDPQYTGTTKVEQESNATVAAPEGAAEGTQYAAGEGVPAWATVNADGTITVKPDLKVAPGDYQIPVVATYTDGSTDDVTATVTVTKKPDNQIYSPELGDITVQANRSAKSPAIEGLPEGTKFSLAEEAPSWATIDDQGVVRLNPDGDVPPQNYDVPVTITYPDGTVDNATLKVTVTDRAINEVHDPTYAPIEVKQTETGTVAAPQDSTADAEYALGAGAPNWVTLNNDGSIEARPGLDVEPGDYQIPVTVIYGDDSADRTNAVVTVTVKPTNELHDPEYSDVSVKQGDEATVSAPTDVADGTKFTAGEGVPEWVTVAEDGTVTAKPGLDVEAKDYTVPVKVSYEDGSGDDATVNITVTVKPTNELHDPEYSDVSVKQGDEVTAAAPADVAEGATFEKGEGAPEWVTVAEDGTVTAKPGLDVEAKDYTVPVKVSYKDGSGDDTTVNITVTVKLANEIHDPTYSDVTVKQGDEVTAAAPADVAEGATFEKGEGAPEWVTVAEDGTVTAKPGLDVEAKDYTVPVKVSYEDGSGDDATVNITVTVKPANEIYAPSFEVVSVKQGETATSKVSGDTGEGAKFAAGEGAPKWADVKEDGTVTLKPSTDVKPGEHKIPVVVTYPDGTNSTVNLTVNIEIQDKPTGSSGSSDSSTGATGSSKAGKIFAIIFGILAVGAGLVGLHNWARANGFIN